MFAVGVLAFLAVDAGAEALEFAEEVPGAFEGIGLVVLGVLGALLLVQSVSSWRQGREATGDERAGSGLWLAYLIALGLLAGAPVILGGWIGGLAYSPTIGALFLAIGVGAILQVVWEAVRKVRGQGGRAASALNLLAVLAGLAVMYATDLFVAI